MQGLFSHMTPGNLLQSHAPQCVGGDAGAHSEATR